MTPSNRFGFYVHRRVPAWRLVLPVGAPPPSQMIAEDWTFSREREAADTNPDVRALCDTDGYCLFKIGGRFEEVARDAGRTDP